MTEPTKAPHPHAKLIKAWADGAIIEVLTSAGYWAQLATPTWSVTRTYRIKPEPPEPIVIVETMRYSGLASMLFDESRSSTAHKVKFTVDPVTREILSVELVKE